MTSRVLVSTLALALLAGCQSAEKASGKLEDVVEVRATVTAVDVPQRHITLKDADGVEVVVAASEAVKNLGQIVPGDEVLVSYTEAIHWKVKSPDQGQPGVAEGGMVGLSKPGDKPSGKIGRSVTVTATITHIDLDANTFTLTGPRGNTLTLKARDPENLKKAKVGDLIDISYSATVAVAVRPAPKA